MRLLIVEDEKKVADALQEGLRDDWKDIVVEYTRGRLFQAQYGVVRSRAAGPGAAGP